MENQNKEKNQKNNFKGLLIIGVVLLIIIIAIIGGNGPVRVLDIGRETGPGGITLPAGFTEHKAPHLGFIPEMEGITMSTYMGPGTAEDALNVFKTSAIDAGWTSVLGKEIPTIGIPGVGVAGTVITGAGFEKGDKMLVIHIMQAEDQVTVMVVEAPKWQEEFPTEEWVPEEIGPPTLDVEGNDISDLPRYPGSVRTSYWRMDFGDGGEAITVTYITSVNVSEVLKFYQEKLPVNGWTDITEMQMEDAFWLMGYREGVNARVSINPDTFYVGYTSIGITVDR